MKTGDRILHAVVAAIAAIACTAAAAQASLPSNGGTTSTGEFQPGSKAERQASQQFVDQAAIANRAEIQEGRYIVNHTGSAAVRKFARKLLHDHTLAQDQLKEIASREGLDIPAGVSSRDQAAFAKLKQEHGAQLDRAYSSSQEQDHEQVIAKFQKAEKNPDLLTAVRDYARKTLPTLQEHLHLAQKLVATKSNGNHNAG